MAFSIRALASALVPSTGQSSHFSSTVTKSHKTHPVNLAPLPMLQCRPTTHFLMLALSPTFVPSPSKLSGEICAELETGGPGIEPSSPRGSVGVAGEAWTVIFGGIDRKNRLLSSQYPASEFARMR